MLAEVKKGCFYLQDIVEITGGTCNFTENILFTGISTDTRTLQKGDLFIALSGDTFDGKDFLLAAKDTGASGVLVDESVSKDVLKNLSLPSIIVRQTTLLAYQKLALAYRKKFSIPVVAVTGSNGKTTTKELIAHILSQKFSVCKTKKNFNNEIGVPQTLLSIKENDGAVVVELGMRGLGQIKELSDIVEPTVGVITNVGDTHIELLGSIENIALAKGELVDGIVKNGMVVLNADNDYVYAMKNKEVIFKNSLQVLTFGIENNADATAKNISFTAKGTEFLCDIKGEKVAVKTSLLGLHNVYNVLAAMVTTSFLGVETKVIKSALATFVAPVMRFSREAFHDITLINDTYNASPLSMEAALNTLGMLDARRRLAVLGDMLELGDFARKAHEEIGTSVIKNHIDVLLTLGTCSKYIKNVAEKKGLQNAWHFENSEEVAKKLSQIAKKGDVILFKASRGLKLENVITLFKTYFS